MNKSIKAPWVGWPNQEYARDFEDLSKTGARCDAWRSFLQSETMAALKKVKGYVLYFNQHSYFDTLILECTCSEKKLRAVIEPLMRPDYKEPIICLRNDIYDARAWAHIPLNCFAEINGCNDRRGKSIWQHEVLEQNEMPIVQFGIKKPWVVKRECFTLTHRLRDHDRKATMVFNHPQLDFRFKGGRWVADQVFPREATRAEMAAVLFAKVEKECANHLVTIQ